ncbi:adenylyl-sulfate kinase [bacterium M00.F.Ca.ET.228.01.1.1]|nr:adenylyl-sulfate kinase [Paraburkholderia phenoliruptrix]MBW9099474.1 adenylyl-sulfate kinase [Paraburkholderia phenoliruptrix]TGP39483.1 adenylyl-sulfate kinase [bacterium M00.F.Ca.ET.228.01.1.1]TGR95212.1 adenylyl-sulfate kinase [bacterium M00.F.Ca.ET.191.01.1.1]TGT96017.1 adenylyl-sulfate kinase [bacterium M00.F.Ca.ET.155.01.1.1]
MGKEQPNVTTYLLSEDIHNRWQQAPFEATPRAGANLNVHPPRLIIDKRERSALKQQQPCVVWLTGLSAAGKTTIANRLEQRLHEAGYHTYLLDGDNLRFGLNRDLGFSNEERAENIRRAAEVAKLMVDAGLIVISAFISPFRAERLAARQLFARREFTEVYVDTPLDVAERRDPKGLYKKAREGTLRNFTGIDSSYEPPLSPEIHIATVSESVEQSVARILTRLSADGRIAI